MGDLAEDPSVFRGRLKSKLERDCGPAFMAAMHDPQTVEVMLNADGRLWQERLGHGMALIGEIRSIQAQAILKSVASFHGLVVTRESPRLECEWPLDLSRFAGAAAPLRSR
jgi:Flp pilus assembly CpaF family ATPase